MEQKHKLEHTSETLIHVHDKTRCRGQNCTIHNMSRHHLRGWPQHWRSDRGIMERTDPWGCGHPDPDDPTKDRGHGCIVNPVQPTQGVCEPWKIYGVPATWLTQSIAITQAGRMFTFDEKRHPVPFYPFGKPR